VAFATSFTVSCLAQVNPGSTMFGFRIIPSSITRCSLRCMKTARRTDPVTVPHWLNVWSPSMSTSGSMSPIIPNAYSP